MKGSEGKEGNREETVGTVAQVAQNTGKVTVEERKEGWSRGKNERKY